MPLLISSVPLPSGLGFPSKEAGFWSSIDSTKSSAFMAYFDLLLKARRFSPVSAMT